MMRLSREFLRMRKVFLFRDETYKDKGIDKKCLYNNKDTKILWDSSDGGVTTVAYRGVPIIIRKNNKIFFRLTESKSINSPLIAIRRRLDLILEIKVFTRKKNIFIM